MIQRIQTVYLMVATLVMVVALIFPIATLNADGNELVIKAFGFSAEGVALPHLPLYMGILLAIATALPFVIIFLYKRRMVQFRLCGVELALLVGALIFEAVYCYIAFDALNAVGAVELSLGFAAFMPLVAIPFVALAMKGILRDELLVRSLDRIR